MRAPGACRRPSRRARGKGEANVELLTDFFLLAYARTCAHDPDTLFAKMARFLRGGDFRNILGYDED